MYKMRDKKGVMCYSRRGKTGMYKTCVDKTNAQITKGARPQTGRYPPEPTPKKRPTITQPEQLRKLSVMELRKLARGRGVSGAKVSVMKKEELVKMLAPQPKRRTGDAPVKKERPYDMTGKRKKKD